MNSCELRKKSEYKILVSAWTAGTAVYMDVSGCILRVWMPAIHAGMTKAADDQIAVKYWRRPSGCASFYALLQTSVGS